MSTSVFETTPATPPPNANAIYQKKVARGDVVAGEPDASTQDPATATTNADGSTHIQKPDGAAFTQSFVVDTVVYIFLIITCLGAVGVYMSQVAYSNVMPGIDLNLPTQPSPTIMNIIRKWGWSLRPEQTWGQTAEFTFHPDAAFYALFTPKSVDGAPPSVVGIQPYVYEILKYISHVNNLCSNYVFGAFYHLPQWATMILFAPLAMPIFMLFMLINAIFHLVAVVKYIPVLFNYGDESLEEKLGHLCYACFHLFVMSWVIPWATTIAAFVAPFRATSFTWATDASDASGASTTAPKSFRHFFGASVKAMQPFILTLITLSMISKSNIYLGDSFTGSAVLSAMFFMYRGWYGGTIHSMKPAMAATFRRINQSETETE